MKQIVQKMDKERKKREFFLVALTFFFCWLFCLRQGVFGAKVDWLSQHSVFADYFRQQFYETGQLFPEFAANIGGGQNIYHFAYYGLYSPVVMLSYLFPFVKMSDYLMAAQLLSLAAAVLLMYRWLRKKGFEEIICVGCSVIFLLAGPMIFQSYSQIMFANYMPFLVLAFMGVDQYFQSDGRLLTVSVFLMIMTSFYFSIGGMLALVLYGVYRYFQINDAEGVRVTPGRFVVDGVRFLLPMLTAVLMSAVLLVPTAMALMGQGRDGGTKQSLAELLIPELSLNRIFYSPYGVGLTTLALVAVLTGLTYKKRAERVLYISTLSVFVVPVFAWLLNGGLYARDKVMIPFLPLLCYMTADYLRKQKQKEISLAAGAIPYLIVATLIFVERSSAQSAAGWKMLMADILSLSFCFGVFWRRRKVALLLVPTILFLVVFDSTYHMQADRMLERVFYEKITDDKTGDMISETLAQETGFYRTEQQGTDRENEANLNRIWDMGQYISSVYSSTYNAEYQDFRRQVFLLEEPFRNILMQSASKNPVFQRFMGVKYIVAENPAAGEPVSGESVSGESVSEEPAGYKLYRSCGSVNVYENSEVLPVAYATSRTMGQKEYEELGFPYNQLALLDYAVIDEEEFKQSRAIEKEEVSEENGATEKTEVSERSGATAKEERVPAGSEVSGENGRSLGRSGDSEKEKSWGKWNEAFVNQGNLFDQSESLSQKEGDAYQNKLFMKGEALSEQGEEGVKEKGASSGSEVPAEEESLSSQSEVPAEKESLSGQSEVDEKEGSLSSQSKVSAKESISNRSEQSMEVEGMAKQIELSIEEKRTEEGTLCKTADGFQIQTNHTLAVRAALPGKAKEGEILFLRFRVKNNKPSRDVAIWVNDVRNKLSAKSHIYYNENDRFTYAISLEEGQSSVEIQFGEGEYEIADVECFVGEISGSKERLCQSEFQMDRERTEGNRIAGSIDVREDGYFVTTIPYDSGFEVRKDGKNIPYTKVNTAFLGFPIEKGEHTIEIVYHAPGVLAGKMLSLVGILFFLYSCIKRKGAR